MRAILAAIFLLMASPAVAEHASDPADAGWTADRSPTAAELIGGLFRFDRFQQSLVESADLNGNQEVRNLATLRAEDAAKRDKALKQIQGAIGAEASSGKQPLTDGGRLAVTDNSEGPSYIRSFYAAQITEYSSVVALIENYLKAPDNDTLSGFAREQLPILQSELADAERTMADK